MQAGASSGDEARAATAAAARATAARVAEAGSAPERSSARSVAAPVPAAVDEAVSGRGEEDTPSQTTPIVRPSAATSAMASSLRACRRPRSLTPAAPPASTSTWSLSAG
nr:hypothetical protein GCM10020093_000680 [Planobispora longispora]